LLITAAVLLSLLQEANAMAILDVAAAKITAIFPAGFKNHALARNPLDPSDRDGGANIKSWPVFGKYQADEIKAFSDRGVDYIVAANEGDERDWPGAAEVWLWRLLV
jgi:hypothetical protein